MKRIQRYIFLLIILVTMIVGGWFSVNKPTGSVKNISIVGCQMLNESMMKAQIDSAFQGTEERIAEQIREFVEKNRIVDRVIVKEENFDEIVIEIHERKPVAAVTSASRKVLVDRIGKSISSDIRSTMNTLPNIVLYDSGVVSESTTKDDIKLLATFLHELQIKHEHIYEVVSEIVQCQSTSWMVYRCDFEYPIIVAPSEENIHALVHTFSNLQNTFYGYETVKDIEYIDLRFKNRVIYGGKQETVAKSPRRS